MVARPLLLGRVQGPGTDARPFELPAHHLVTHGAIVGMTGSGKTGLAMVLVEEALRSSVPVLVVDVKGDLPNLLLTFPNLAPEEFAPWIDPDAAAREGAAVADIAARVAARWREGLAAWGLGAADVAELVSRSAPRVLTPGSTAGEPVNLLSSLEGAGELWEADEEAAREAISASVSLVLRLVERDPDPTKSKEHVLLSTFAERRQRMRLSSGLADLLADLAAPPIDRVGALAVDEFMPPRDRQGLAQDLNALLASPTFASWRQGAPLDVGSWLARRGERTPAIIVSIAHLDDAERALVLGLILDQVLAWVRGLSGTSDLRALVVVDEVFGFLPPHPHDPPTKKPLLALLKQARAFGVGVVVATQNPMDLDYKALSNAGVWMIGRLQTDADRARVVEGLLGIEGAAGGPAGGDLDAVLKALPPRTFFVRDVHATPQTALLESRWAMAWLRGPMTRREISRLVRGRAAPANAPPKEAAVATSGAAALTRAAASAIAPPLDPPRAAAQAATPPEPPEGWRTYHGYPPAPPPAVCRYVPHVAATVTIHVREPKLSIAITRTRTVVAPFGADGRPDLARAGDVDPAYLKAPPLPNATYADLPSELRLKKTRESVIRAMREHAMRTTMVSVDVHADFGLVRAEGERPDAFVQRCAAEATRRAALAHDQIVARHAAKLAALVARVQAARSAVSQAEAEAAAAPGTMGAILVGAVVGRRIGQRMASQQRRAETKVERTRAALAAAEMALAQATSARDAELAILQRTVTNVAAAIETRTIAPKKGDVEVVDVGIAWSVAPWSTES